MEATLFVYRVQNSALLRQAKTPAQVVFVSLVSPTLLISRGSWNFQYKNVSNELDFSA